MPFSPDEIERRQFPISSRGYDPGEVSAFLRELALQYREADRAVRQLRDKLADERRRSGTAEIATELRRAQGLGAQAEKQAARIRAEIETQIATANEVLDRRASRVEQAMRAAHEAERRRAAAERKADDVLTRAWEVATRLLEESKREAAELATRHVEERRGEAEALVALRLGEVDREVAERRAEAFAAAAEIRGDAEREVEQLGILALQAAATMRVEAAVISEAARKELDAAMTARAEAEGDAEVIRANSAHWEAKLVEASRGSVGAETAPGPPGRKADPFEPPVTDQRL